MAQRVPTKTFEVTTPDVYGAAQMLGQFLTEHPGIKLCSHDPAVFDRLLDQCGVVRLMAKQQHPTARDTWLPVDIVVKLTPAAAGSPKDRALST